MPALFTRMLILEKVRSTRRASPSTECTSATSHSITALWPPAFRLAAAVVSRGSRERPHNTARAPSWARLAAMAAPMPRPAPVMTATCPVRGGLDAVLVNGAPRSADGSIVHHPESSAESILVRSFPHRNSQEGKSKQLACLGETTSL